jgi:hypothetical protein
MPLFAARRKGSSVGKRIREVYDEVSNPRSKGWQAFQRNLLPSLTASSSPANHLWELLMDKPSHRHALHCSASLAERIYEIWWPRSIGLDGGGNWPYSQLRMCASPWQSVV